MIAMAWWYLSFVSDAGFLGATIVEVAGDSETDEASIEAVKRAHQLGVNPGGQVLGFKMPEPCACPLEWRNRLLSRQDLENLGAEPISLAEHERRKGAS